MLTKSLAIAKATYLEQIRAKIIYSVICVQILIIALSTFYGRVSYGDHGKILRDFGIFSVSIALILFTIISGSVMVYRELKLRTVFNILSKPISRGEFLIGKFVGLNLSMITLLLLMYPLFLGYSYLLDSEISWALLQAGIYIGFETILLSAVIVFFSAVAVTPALNGMFAISVFLIGRCTDSIFTFAELTDSLILKGLYYILPHLDFLYMGNEAAYGQARGLGSMITSFCYSCSYSGILMVLAIYLFGRRDFN